MFDVFLFDCGPPDADSQNGTMDSSSEKSRAETPARTSSACSSPTMAKNLLRGPPQGSSPANQSQTSANKEGGRVKDPSSSTKIDTKEKSNSRNGKASVILQCYGVAQSQTLDVDTKGKHIPAWRRKMMVDIKKAKDRKQGNSV